jgi:hypothetical protein
MPRKPKQVAVEKKSKKTLLNTIVKNVECKEEHIILQLPLSHSHIDKIINVDKTKEYNYEPLPYESHCCYINEDFNNVEKEEHQECTQSIIPKNVRTENNIACFWCCHSIDFKIYGMPMSYTNKTYLVYGTFCSLQCANAYNFSSYNGSDKVWEINSLIQMMAKKYGINQYIRPAPSRYLLKMFNGNLTIDDFRKMHIDNETTHVLNIPPMISLPASYESVNTSYIKKNSESS